MKGKRSIVIFDTDTGVIQQLQSLLPADEFQVQTITDGTQLLSTIRSVKPSVVLANPDAPGFNAYDVCKYVKRELNIPVILLIDKTSTTRAQIDECDADDVFQKPIDSNGVLNIIKKHIAVDNS